MSGHDDKSVSKVYPVWKADLASKYIIDEFAYRDGFTGYDLQGDFSIPIGLLLERLTALGLDKAALQQLDQINVEASPDTVITLSKTYLVYTLRSMKCFEEDIYAQ
jgi:hypothetical protein